MWALGELGLLRQTGPGTQWKKDDNFSPAGAHIANSLEDTATATTGKSSK